MKTKLNKEGMKYFKITIEDYEKWCRKNCKVGYKLETKKEFYQELWDKKRKPLD